MTEKPQTSEQLQNLNQEIQHISTQMSEKLTLPSTLAKPVFIDKKSHPCRG